MLRFNQRLTGKSPDNLEELREMAFDAEDGNEEEDEGQECGDNSDSDESHNSVDRNPERSHDTDLPHDSSTEES